MCGTMQYRHSAIEASLAERDRDPFATTPIPPEPPLLRDMRFVMTALPVDGTTPEVEWAEDEKTATLRWEVPNGRGRFALVFDGSGHVVGITTSFSRIVPPWKISTRDHGSLTRMLDDPMVGSMIRGRFHLEAI